MPEIFLILFAGGVLLAAAIPDPNQVTVQWLRLAGIIALCLCGLSGYFFFDQSATPIRQAAFFAATAILILIHLALSQLARLRAQRIVGFVVFAAAVATGGDALIYQFQANIPPGSWQLVLIYTTCAGSAAMTGLALMDMLLGHAYLTASAMSMSPFRRLNSALAIAAAARGLLSVAAIFLQSVWPVQMLWPIYGLYIITRWLVGLLVSGIFIYMAHDCIKRRETQSATGILYVAGVLIFIGELIALYLVRQTGLPF